VAALNGQTITYHVNTTAPYHLSGIITTHLCIHNPGGYSTGTFGYGSGSSAYCIYSPGIQPGKVGFNGDFEKQTSAYDPSAAISDSGALTFTAPGTGSSLTWANAIPDGPYTARADATHNLELVIQVNLTGGSVAQTYIVQPLTFAGTPGPPTGVTATGTTQLNAQDQKTTVSWTPPGNTGNGTINHYIVTAVPFSPSGATLTCDAGTNTTLVFNVAGGCASNLTNFQSYHITVHDTISELPGSPSVESTPAVDIQPSPPAPSGVIASGAGSGSANVSWTAPVSSPAYPVASYQVTATDTGASPVSPVVFCSNGAGTSLTPMTGLTDGHPFSFSVIAFYSAACTGNQTLASSAGGPVTPTGFEIDQLITVTRPTGSLVLSQACDSTYPRLTPGGAPDPQFQSPTDPNGPGDPYPQLSDGTVPAGSLLYPTPPAVYSGSCAINLGAAKLITANGTQGQTPLTLGAGYPTNVIEGQFFRADGNIHQVTVVNAREDAQGFDVNAKLTSDFSDTVAPGIGANHISATALGWVPHLSDKSQPFTVPTPGDPSTSTTYTDDVATDPTPILPASGAVVAGPPAPNDNRGLSISRNLAHAVSGLGEAHLDAALHMLIPITAHHGGYTALLQITAI
jgi:hypothetical protein